MTSSGGPPVELFTALADPTRWQVLELLAERPRSASALTRELAVSRTAVLKHLAVLERADLVHRRRQGREVCFDVQTRRLRAAGELISAIGAAWESRLGRLKALAEQPRP